MQSLLMPTLLMVWKFQLFGKKLGDDVIGVQYPVSAWYFFARCVLYMHSCKIFFNLSFCEKSTAQFCTFSNPIQYLPKQNRWSSYKLGVYHVEMRKSNNFQI